MSTLRTVMVASQRFPRLETERLLLRKIVPSDAAALYAIFSDDEVTRYYDLGTMTDPADAGTMVRRMAARAKHGQAIRWGIVRNRIAFSSARAASISRRRLQSGDRL